MATLSAATPSLLNTSRAEQPLRNTSVLQRRELAHDLSNWLCCIEMLANSLPGDGTPEGGLQDVAAQLQHASSEAIELCREFLDGPDQTSDDSSCIAQQMTRVDPKKPFQELRPLMNLFVRDSATLRWAVEDFLPAINGHPTQLKRLVVNLVKNASEALRDEPREITVRCHPTEIYAKDSREETDGMPGAVPGQFLVIEVSDTGCGLDEEAVRNIFDATFTSKSRGSRQGAHGLGLASVKDIVKRHHGWIQVNSAPGKGTTVRVFLPCASAAITCNSDTPGVGSGDHQAAGNVLVIDDQRIMRTVAARLLLAHGFDVTTAASAEQALEILTHQDDDFSAIVMDLRLPGLSGCEAFQRIRMVSPHVPVIVMTGCSEAEIAREFSTGPQPNVIVRKPFDLKSMLAILSTLSERPDLATLAADG